MAVDIKSLRIGSHVLWNGKRRRVDVITEDSIAFRIADSERKEYDSATIEQIEPIVITPELLKELGFAREPIVDKKRHFDFLWQREDVESDDTHWLHGEEDNFFLLHSGPFGQLNVKFLHEAEAFLALHGVELIPD